MRSLLCRLGIHRWKMRVTRLEPRHAAVWWYCGRACGGAQFGDVIERHPASWSA